MRMATEESAPRSVHDSNAAPFAVNTSEGVLEPAGAGDVIATGAPMSPVGAGFSVHAAPIRHARNTVSVLRVRVRAKVLQAVIVSEARGCTGANDPWC